MPPKELWEAYSNCTVHPSVCPEESQIWCEDASWDGGVCKTCRAFFLSFGSYVFWHNINNRRAEESCNKCDLLHIITGLGILDFPVRLVQHLRPTRILKTWRQQDLGDSTFMNTTNKGVDQTVHLHSLVCTFVVLIKQK